MSKDRRAAITCPHCGEETEVETGGDSETLDDWMEEYGWYKAGKGRYICPDCYETEGLR